MKILMFGATGQVARAVLARKPDALALGRDAADLSDPAACAAAIEAHAPEVVINAAAYTAVDKAEEDEALATTINGAATGAMAETAARLGIPFLHISTDYVFDGTGARLWAPQDNPAPISAYGRSKLAGEQAVMASGARAAILRTSWVFSPYGNNFVKTMLRLGRERDTLRVVADQIGGPTPAGAIADALLAMAPKLVDGTGSTGIFHFSGAPEVSWAGFARAIFAEAGIICDVEDIPTSAYPTPAARPLNSRLDCTRLLEDYGIAQPDWRSGVRAMLKELADA